MIGVCTLADPAVRSIWLDSTHVDGARKVPRHRSWCGRVLYADESLTNADLVRIMSPGDVAHGGSPGDVSVLRMRCAGGSYWIVRADTWGVSGSDPNAVNRQICKLYGLAIDHDIEPMRTLSGTARQLYLDRFDGGWIHGLPSRWRGLSHAGIHGGPIVTVSGGGGRHGPPVVCMDIHRAYWRALCRPMAVLGLIPDGHGEHGRYVATRSDWPNISDRVGIVEASVKVLGPTGLGQIPALPVRDPLLASGGAWVYPLGEMRGVWTIEHLQSAVSRGEVDVITVHQAMLSTHQYPIFESMMMFLDTVDVKLAKGIYTRLYGGLAGRGGWERRHNGYEWEWTSQKIGAMDPECPRMYRPDLAASITGYNHTLVFDALRTLDASTVAVHVDAIWSHDIAGADRLDPRVWIAKKTGTVRYYGAGTYVHWADQDAPPRCSAQGWDPSQRGAPSDESLTRFALSTSPDRLSRDWAPQDSGRHYPANNARAVSTPATVTDPPVKSVVAHPNVTDHRWSDRSGQWQG